MRRVYEQKAGEYATRAETLHKVLSARRVASVALPAAPVAVPMPGAAPATVSTVGVDDVLQAGARAATSIRSAARRVDATYDISGKVAHGLQYVCTYVLHV